MPLLLFFLDVCKSRGKLPTNITRILALLNQTTHTDQGPTVTNEPMAVKETAVAIFQGCKTQAYNDLIRVLTYGGAEKEALYEVLYEMYNNDVDKDFETFYNVDQAWQNMRQEYVC